MKKFMLTAAALTVLAGSAFSMSAAIPGQTSTQSASKLTVKTGILPPTCPPSDLDGCGIYR